MRPLYRATYPTFWGAMIFLVLWLIIGAVIAVGEGVVGVYKRIVDAR